MPVEATAMIADITQTDPVTAPPVVEPAAPPVEPQPGAVAAPVGLPDRGPMRALENLLSHAPRDLMKHGERGLDRLLRKIGIKADHLAASMGDADIAAARVQVEFSYQAVRQIDAAGRETFAMQFSFSASVAAVAAGPDGAVAQVQTLSAEGSFGYGSDPQGLLERTFAPQTTADSVANHALDRYRQMLSEQDADDTAASRAAWADAVTAAVDDTAARLRDKYADRDDLLERIEQIRADVGEQLNRFVEEGLPEAGAPDAGVQLQQQMWLHLELQRTLVRSYASDGAAVEPAPEPEPEAVDAAA